MHSARTMTESELTTNGRNADFIRALNAESVEFIVVGGLAVAYHGCRDIFEVDDLDLMLCPEEMNIQRFISALAELGLRDSLSPSELAKANVQIPFKHDFYLDILTPPPSMDFTVMYRSSIQARLNGNHIRVIDRQNLIALKRLAVESTTKVYEKHRIDLKCLEGA